MSSPVSDDVLFDKREQVDKIVNEGGKQKALVSVPYRRVAAVASYGLDRDPDEHPATVREVAELLRARGYQLWTVGDEPEYQTHDFEAFSCVYQTGPAFGEVGIGGMRILAPGELIWFAADGKGWFCWLELPETVGLCAADEPARRVAIAAGHAIDAFELPYWRPGNADVQQRRWWERLRDRPNSTPAAVLALAANAPMATGNVTFRECIDQSLGAIGLPIDYYQFAATDYVGNGDWLVWIGRPFRAFYLSVNYNERTGALSGGPSPWYVEARRDSPARETWQV